MQAWKDHDHIPLDFCNCQLDREIRSEDESYIKSVCRERLRMAGTFVQLIGHDTRSKHKYVRWEAEVSLEQDKRLIGVNLNGVCWMQPETCPPILRDRGALFVPFDPNVLAFVLSDFPKQAKGDWYARAQVYDRVGYLLYPGEREQLI